MKTLTMHKWVKRHWLQCATAWGVAVAGVFIAPVVSAQEQPILGQLMLTGAAFCPKGWVYANGQLLSVAQNQTLFALLGTTYGGDGVRTFALPNLQGRAAVHQGAGPGLSLLALGQTLGLERTALSVSNLPAHSHSQSLSAGTSAATHSAPAGRQLAQSQNAGIYADASGTTVPLEAGNTGVTGSGAALDIRSPALVMNWCIATVGVYPQRD